jgi:hypothetical protein
MGQELLAVRANIALKADWPEAAQFLFKSRGGQPLSSTLGRTASPQESPGILQAMASTFYDADLAPSPALWFGMSAQERVRLVANFHSAVRIRMKGRTHAVLHVVVENYIAQGFR